MLVITAFGIFMLYPQQTKAAKEVVASQSTLTTKTAKKNTCEGENCQIKQAPIAHLTPKEAFIKGVQFSQNGSQGSNMTKAVNYIQYSAATGYAEAQFKLGLMYFQGVGVQANSAVGFYWIQKAARNDYPEAQIYLAYMYKKGIGVPVDMFQSNYWLRQAKRNGIDVNITSLDFM